MIQAAVYVYCRQTEEYAKSHFAQCVKHGSLVRVLRFAVAVGWNEVD